MTGDACRECGHPHDFHIHYTIYGPDAAWCKLYDGADRRCPCDKFVPEAEA